MRLKTLRNFNIFSQNNWAVKMPIFGVKLGGSRFPLSPIVFLVKEMLELQNSQGTVRKIKLHGASCPRCPLIPPTFLEEIHNKFSGLILGL